VRENNLQKGTKKERKNVFGKVRKDGEELDNERERKKHIKEQ